jgi:hypothetical protein
MKKRINLAILQEKVNELQALLPHAKLTLESWGRKYQVKVNGRTSHFGTTWLPASDLWERIDFAISALTLRNRYGSKRPD